jgi:zinc protease
MYYGLVPRENLDAGMALLAGALREPSIARDALAQEIEVVLAEFDLNDSDSEAVIRRRVLDLLFAPLANRKQPIGDRDVIAAATPDKLRALYDRYYVPNNALLVLSGDIDAARGSALAKKYFGDWKRGPDPFKTRPVPKFPPLARDAVDVVSMQRNDSRLVVAWQGPDPAHDDRAALAADLIGPIALQSSQFFRSTVGGGVIGAGLGFTRATRTGMLSAELEITSGEESAAVSRLRAVLNGLPDSITDEQVETAKDTIWSARFSNADASSGAAFQIAGDWAYSGFDYHSEYLDRLYDLTREDVVDVLERYVLGQPKAAVLSGKALSPDSAGVPQLKEPW